MTTPTIDPTATPTIDPTAEQLQGLAASPGEGPVLMLNLLRFKDRADGIDAADDISGEEAYRRYGAAIASNLEQVGGSLELLAACKEHVIGPDAERWDLLVLARYPSRAAFLAMVGDPDFQAKHAHRTAAVADSRLICCEQSSG